MNRPAAAAIAVAAAATLAACGKDRSKPKPKPAPPVTGGSGDAVVADARAYVPPEAAALPGAIWFTVDAATTDAATTQLWRLAGGAAVALGERLYPSGNRLPDGRQVVIASRGAADQLTEQLALVEPALDAAGAPQVAALGPAAPQVREPAVDAAGRWLVVAAVLDGHSELYRIDLPGGDHHQITDNPEGNFHPTPLGAGAIAFASSRDGDSEIYRCDLDGKHVQRLTAFHKDDWDPVASPDGATIAFLSDREGPARIFVMAADGTGQRRLTDRTEPELEEAQPVWSPDGTRLAYVAERGSEHHLFVQPVAAGAAGRGLTPDDARDTDPAFSPDGSWIVVARATMHADGDDHDLWAIPVGGGPAIRLTAGGGTEGLPRWMP